MLDLVWLSFVGFGLVWLDLVGFGWIWFVLIWFGLDWWITTILLPAQSISTGGTRGESSNRHINYIYAIRAFSL